MSQRVIYKYHLGMIPPGQVMNVPAYFPNKLTKGDSRILHVGWAIDGVYVWVEHPYPFEGNTGTFQIAMQPTGHVFDDTYSEHIGTVVDPTGMAWHYYEV